MCCCNFGDVANRRGCKPFRLVQFDCGIDDLLFGVAPGLGAPLELIGPFHNIRDTQEFMKLDNGNPDLRKIFVKSIVS